MIMKTKKNKPGAGRPVSFWTKERVKKLKALFPVTDNEEIAAILGSNVTVSAVRNAATRLGLTKQSRYWTPEDIAHLQKHWADSSAEKIAEELGKTRWAVINKYRELLSKKPGP